jgi:hypothetical protein
VKVVQCPQCNHQNDSPRSFCQNCGARLEQSSYDPPNKSAAKKGAPASRTRGHAASRGFVGAVFWFIRRIVFVAILAAMLAALIQMARQPDGIPPAQPPNEAQAGQLLQTLQTFAGSTYPRTIEVTEAQANNYLAASIVPDPATTGKPWQADFSRAFVVIKSGRFDFFVEQRFHGWPLYMCLTTVPELSGDKLTVKVVGGAVGRMPVHRRLVPLLQAVLRPVIVSTSEAASVLETVDEVVLTPSTAKLSWRARRPPAP